MFKLFANSMMNGRAFIPMMDADNGGGAGSGNGNGEGGQGTGDGQNGTGEGEGNGEGGADGKDGKDDDKEEKLTFSEQQQAEIDKIIARTIAKERSKAESERQKAEERAKMSAEEKAEAERKEREQKAQEREQQANAKIIGLEIKDVARGAGVPAKKIERFMKLVDRDEIDIDDNGDVNRSDVEKAVKAVLADMPEFKGSEDPKGPGGDFNGGGAGVKYTKQQIESMTPQEIAKDYDNVMKSMAVHNKK